MIDVFVKKDFILLMVNAKPALAERSMILASAYVILHAALISITILNCKNVTVYLDMLSSMVFAGFVTSPKHMMSIIKNASVNAQKYIKSTTSVQGSVSVPQAII